VQTFDRSVVKSLDTIIISCNFKVGEEGNIVLVVEWDMTHRDNSTNC
jgi:hypothetical protein